MTAKRMQAGVNEVGPSKGSRRLGLDAIEAESGPGIVIMQKIIATELLKIIILVLGTPHPIHHLTLHSPQGHPLHLRPTGRWRGRAVEMSGWERGEREPRLGLAPATSTGTGQSIHSVDHTGGYNQSCKLPSTIPSAPVVHRHSSCFIHYPRPPSLNFRQQKVWHARACAAAPAPAS